MKTLKSSIASIRNSILKDQSEPKTWHMGPCPWFMLVCWGKGGMPVFWVFKWDLNIPTKSQERESSEECTGSALAQNSSHITPAWHLRLSCRSREPQLLREAGWVQVGQQ